MPRKVRRKSVRGYRRTLDELIEQARRGNVPWTDVSSASSAIKTATEMLMAENLMKTQGVVDAEPEDHALGEDGGVAYHPNRRGKRFANTKTTVKTGVSPKGAYKETMVATEGAANDEDTDEDTDE